MNEYKLKSLLKQNTLDIHIESTVNSGSFETHTHDFCELVFIVSGKGKHTVGDVEYDLKSGDIFIIKGSERHGFSNLENLRLFNIMFNVHELQTEDCKNLTGFWVLFVHEQTSGFLSHLNVSGDDYQQVLQWCRHILQEYTAHQPGYISVCHSILMQLIVFLSRKYQDSDQFSRQMDFRLARSIVYMQTNFSAKITIDELAEMVGFSKRHYSRLFQQTYGMSPIQFLNEIRLNRAKLLLESGNYKVTEVATRCGFQDGNYFSRFFKQKYDRAPSEWR